MRMMHNTVVSFVRYHSCSALLVYSVGYTHSESFCIVANFLFFIQMFCCSLFVIFWHKHRWSLLFLLLYPNVIYTCRSLTQLNSLNHISLEFDRIAITDLHFRVYFFFIRFIHTIPYKINFIYFHWSNQRHKINNWSILIQCFMYQMRRFNENSI